MTGKEGEWETVTESQLVREVEECEQYSFLLGAGCSKAGRSNVPTAGELITQWRETCYEDANPDHEFDQWIGDVENSNMGEDEGQYGFWFERLHPSRGGRREYIANLVEEAEPNLGHILLATMMNKGYVPHVLTPNFDDLLFDAFYYFLEDRPNLIDHRAVAPEFKITRDRPAIVKLHGDYLYNNLQNTTAETRNLEPAMEEALQQTVSEYGLVVVGYSGGDDSIMNPLLDEDLEFSEYGIYWCTRNPEDIEPEVQELLEREESHLVEIEGFVNLMTKFGQGIDNVELPEEDQLVDRAEGRASFLSGALEDRQNQAQDEEEAEFLDKTQRFREANEAYEKKDYERAIELFDKVVEIDPEFIGVYNQRGNAKAELGRHEDAIEDYDQEIKLDPEDPIAYANRGNEKAELGRYEDAIEDYNQAIEHDPEYAVAYANRGIAKANLGRFKDAIEDYNQAIELEPEDSKAYQNLSETRIRIGEFEKARSDTRQSKPLTDSTAELTQALMLELIASICLNDDTESLEEEYRKQCEKEFTTTWSFEELDTWLETADLEPKKRERIEDVINCLRAHKTDS